MIPIRPTRESDHAAIVAIGNAVSPDRITHTVENFRSAIRSQPAIALAQSYVADIEGRVLGHLWLNQLIFVPDAHTWYADIQVHPTAQGRGIGSRLYDFLSDRLAQHGVRQVHAGVREDLAMARQFARHRGFRETGHGDRPSRLEVRTANAERGRLTAERLQREGIRIATQAELHDIEEIVLRGTHALINEAHVDMPSSREWTFMPFDEWQRQRAEEGLQPDMIWLAMDGDRVAGLAGLVLRGENTAYTGLTAVARSHRGRGVARALKYQQVAWARQHGVTYLYTENDVENAPMLHINTEMGFRPLPADVELVKDLDPRTVDSASR